VTSSSSGAAGNLSNRKRALNRFSNRQNSGRDYQIAGSIELREMGQADRYQKQGLGGYEDDEEYNEVSLDKSDRKHPL
jgi:hypothetical protein